MKISTAKDTVLQYIQFYFNNCEVQKVPYAGKKCNINKLRAMKKIYLPFNLALNTGTQPIVLVIIKRNYIAEQLLYDQYTFKRKY